MNALKTAGALLIAVPLIAVPRGEIRGGRFYVDGQPFFVRGIGYAPWRPHQHPGLSSAETNRRWTEMDFERIKAAHFNTIRTWDPLDPADLKLAQNQGLMVLQGIRLDAKQDFSDPHNQEVAIELAKDVAEKSKAFDNVLGYVVMSQPLPEAVLESGEADTMMFFRRVRRAIQSIDPRPVSMDAWPPVAFLDLHEFDFVTVNLFAFWPKSLNHALGLAGMTRWFVDHFASDRPLIVGETGGYSVSKSSAGPAGGAGGYSEYDQSIHDLESVRATVEGHAQGSVLVSWIDPWYYPSDPDVHNNDPWEWDGIVGIPTDSKKDMDGVPRQAYADFTSYNELIVIDPKNNHDYQTDQPIPIEALGADNVSSVEYNVNGGDWIPLEGSGQGWFHGFFKLPKAARHRQQISLRALDDKHSTLETKKMYLAAAAYPETITLDPAPPSKTGAGLRFAATLLDGYHRPVTHRKIDFGCFLPVSLRETQGTINTNGSSSATFTCAVTPSEKDAYLFVAAGTENSDHVRAGEMHIYSLKK